MAKKSYLDFRSVILDPRFSQQLLAAGEMPFGPLLFSPKAHRRLGQAITWTERFRIIQREARQAGHRIDHCLVNSQGEQKILSDVTFVASQLMSNTKGSSHIGHYMGVDIFLAPQQAEMIVFVVETDKGFFVISGNDVQPFEHPGPVFIMEIKP